LQKLREATSIERHLRNLLIGDERGDGSGLRLQQGRFAGDLHGLLHVSQCQLEIQRERVRRRQLDTQANQLLKSRMLHAYRDPTSGHGIGYVLPAAVGHSSAGEFCTLIYESYVRPRDHRAPLIDDCTHDCPALRLSESSTYGQAEQNGAQKRTSDHDNLQFPGSELTFLFAVLALRRQVRGVYRKQEWNANVMLGVDC